MPLNAPAKAAAASKPPKVSKRAPAARNITMLQAVAELLVIQPSLKNSQIPDFPAS
jgi:hypothetical protein